jgi:hypothetical protein
VTGKADGVAGVVRSVVHVIAARETCAGQKEKPEGEDENTGELTLADCYG